VKIIGIEGGSRNQAGGILNALYRVEVATMKSKRSLMTALIGLAMLATPIVAAAKDHKDHDGDGRNYSHQSEYRSYNAGNRHEFRNARGNGAWAHRDWNEDRHDNGWHNGWCQNDGDADDYANYGYSRNYGNRGYYNRPAYVAPYYGRSGYASAGGACGWAQHVRNVYNRDRYTGHPAAARDLLPQLRRAEQACGGVPYGGGRGLFSGFAGVPAYENYGGYNGYNNSNYSGYNGGYGQPYGYGYGNGYGSGASMLAPLLQQFVH
jgi:hypothetical protein